MSNIMLIDAAHAEETRVAIIDKSNTLIDFDFNSSSKKTCKGNVYLAKVARVEPSLQAAFIDYGGDRHGFLAFNEIHPDYFRIPVSDREKLQQEIMSLSSEPEGIEGNEVLEGNGAEDEDRASPENAGRRRFASLHRRYKIQEVIQKGQIVLIQVVKEERGGKGAALTTFLSLPGRYCVLMPNSPRSGGVSRKISNQTDRARLKKNLDALDLPHGMGLIVRTAGKDRTRTEIKKDAEYLMRLWNNIREVTLGSIAPSVIYHEDDIIKRAIRDMYSKDIEEILVEGDEGYKVAKNFMKTLMPSHAKKIKQYKDPSIPLFHSHGLETQVETMHHPVVLLPSGGSIVIHPTEALVSIDINSGKSTRERHIEETAFKTNLEAATEIARQIRLRDLAGLVVIDFIDMDDPRNVAAVERRVKESFKQDRARVQMGKISNFGLLELSRQRLSPSLLETSTHPCTHCHGTGYVRSTESLAIYVLRMIEKECLKPMVKELLVKVSTSVAFYIFNNKRATLDAIESRQSLRVIIEADAAVGPEGFVTLASHYTKEELLLLADKKPELLPLQPIILVGSSDDDEIEDDEVDSVDDADAEKDEKKPKRNRRNQRRQRNRQRQDDLPKLEGQEGAVSSEIVDIKVQEKPETKEVVTDADGNAIQKPSKNAQRRKRRRKSASRGSKPDSQELGAAVESGNENSQPTDLVVVPHKTAPAGEKSEKLVAKPGHKKPSENKKNHGHKEISVPESEKLLPIPKVAETFSLTPLDALIISPSLQKITLGDVVPGQGNGSKKANQAWWRRILNSPTSGTKG